MQDLIPQPYLNFTRLLLVQQTLFLKFRKLPLHFLILNFELVDSRSLNRFRLLFNILDLLLKVVLLFLDSPLEVLDHLIVHCFVFSEGFSDDFGFSFAFV